MKDYYLILGIDPYATQEEIKKAYRTMSLKYHPDKNQGDKYFEERFKDIGEAFEILFDIEKRKSYDYNRLANYAKNTNNKTGPNASQNVEIINNEKVTDNKGSNINILALFMFFILTIGASSLLYFQHSKENTPKVSLPNSIKVVPIVTEKDEAARFNALVSNNYPKRGFDMNKILNENKGGKKLKNTRKAFTEESENYQEGNFNTRTSNNVKVKKNDEVDLYNFTWGEYDYISNEKEIQKLSVKNKTEREIKYIDVSYEVESINGKKLNSGNLKLSASYSESILPGKAKEINVNGEGLHKRPNEILILTIENVTYTDQIKNPFERVLN